MELYHVTKIKYVNDSTISVGSLDGLAHYYNQLSKQNKMIDDFLSVGRPENEPPRNNCLYAFDKPEYCYYYGAKQMLNANKLYIYKCELDCYLGHPMVLVGFLSDNNLTNRQKEMICKEYWNPVMNWHYMEYLSTEMTIISEEPITEELKNTKKKSLLDYTEDFDQAKKMLGL